MSKVVNEYDEPEAIACAEYEKQRKAREWGHVHTESTSYHKWMRLVSLSTARQAVTSPA